MQIEEQIVEVRTILYQEKVVEARPDRPPNCHSRVTKDLNVMQVPKVQETILLKQVPRVEAPNLSHLDSPPAWLNTESP